MSSSSSKEFDRDADLKGMLAEMCVREQMEFQAQANTIKAQIDAAFIATSDLPARIRMLANAVGHVFSSATKMFGSSVSDANMQRYWGKILAVVTEKWQTEILGMHTTSTTPNRASHLTNIQTIRKERLQASVASIPMSQVTLIAAYWKLADAVLPLPALLTSE